MEVKNPVKGDVSESEKTLRQLQKLRTDVDKLWKTMRITHEEVLRLRTEFDIIDRKANRISVAASRSKAEVPMMKSSIDDFFPEGGNDGKL